MSQRLISQEELQQTIEYLNYNGPLFSELPPDPETERKLGSSKVVASSAF